ncbi:MAG: hypothetical protein HQL21_09350 [Candidatus Omnitrophica bacterium]|nr:hypothetical protein [Candidatus Omnitrophota bacterium]
MSIFWDQRRKAPQLWTYPFFILLAVGLCVGVYSYGMKKASQMPEDEESQKSLKTF